MLKAARAYQVQVKERCNRDNSVWSSKAENGRSPKGAASAIYVAFASARDSDDTWMRCISPWLQQHISSPVDAFQEWKRGTGAKTIGAWGEPASRESRGVIRSFALETSLYRCSEAAEQSVNLICSSLSLLGCRKRLWRLYWPNFTFATWLSKSRDIRRAQLP